jgi:hypothetical protein
MPYTTQCTKPRAESSGSSISRVSSAVPLGTLDDASGGETGLLPLRAYLTGIVFPSVNAGLVAVMETPEVERWAWRETCGGGSSWQSRAPC